MERMYLVKRKDTCSMLKCFLSQTLLIAWLYIIIAVVDAQRSGFISIDCGSNGGYTDKHTLDWVEDKGFTQTGKNGRVTATTVSEAYLQNLRYFPSDNTHTCYSLPAVENTRYLVRSTFFYGNYDGKLSPPTFELSIDTAIVAIVDTTTLNTLEIIKVATTSSIQVCLHIVRSQDIPFISALELRPLASTMYDDYANAEAFITRVFRINYGATASDPIRYPADIFDRIWESDNATTDSNLVENVQNAERINTTNDLNVNRFERPPEAVMQTAIVSQLNTPITLQYSLPNPFNYQECLIIAHYAEIQDLSTSDRRTMILTLNQKPQQATTTTSYKMYTNYEQPVTALLMGQLSFLLNNDPSSQSTVGPLLNALEAYTVNVVPAGTLIQDKNSIQVVATAFSLKGYTDDPCIPYAWSWVNCSSDSPSRVVAINLSGMQLVGTISPSILNLTALTDLWLNNNSLTGFLPDHFDTIRNLRTLHLQNNRFSGAIPEDLANLSGLKELFLDDNQLSGAVPSGLTTKQSSGFLDLRVSGNAAICVPDDPICLNEKLGTSPTGAQGASTRTKKGKKGKGGLIGGVVSAVLFIIILVIAFCFFWRRKRNKSRHSTAHDAEDPVLPAIASVASPGVRSLSSEKHSKEGSMPDLPTKEKHSRKASLPGTPNVINARSSFDASQQDVQRFRPADIKKATKNFSIKIGEGGFGPVYYGKLTNQREIAVKVRSTASKQGATEFLTEVDILSRAKHPNLVTLIGHCEEEKQYMLIYEYLSLGTLQDRLYGAESFNQEPLKWNDRIKIALDAAKGIEYLHCECKPTIIHRDVKSSNILLNETLDAKVADFGLSKIAPGGPTGYVSTMVKGTSGYLDPEYYESNRLTQKSDVYSFGIVLLEIISGRQPLNVRLPRNQWKLPDWARNCLQEGKIEEIVDTNIASYSLYAMWKVAELAMTCVEPRGIHRPSITEIVTELHDALEVERNDSKNRRASDSGALSIALQSDHIMAPSSSNEEKLEELEDPVLPNNAERQYSQNFSQTFSQKF